MNEKANAKGRASLLDLPRIDLASAVLPRCPDFPPSNYTYGKHAEAMRAEAAKGPAARAWIATRISKIAGSNTYARIARSYGQLLIAHLDREAELEAAIEAAKAEVDEAAAKEVA